MGCSRSLSVSIMVKDRRKTRIHIKTHRCVTAQTYTDTHTHTNTGEWREGKEKKTKDSHIHSKIKKADLPTLKLIPSLSSPFSTDQCSDCLEGQKRCDPSSDWTSLSFLKIVGRPTIDHVLHSHEPKNKGMAYYHQGFQVKPL